MINDPPVTTPEIFEGHNFKLVVHDRSWNFEYDSYYIMEPNESKSDAWEVWEAEWLDDEMTKADLNHILLEAHGKAIVSLESLHLVLSILKIGFDCGYKDGLTTMQRANKFAFQSLSGDIDGADLIEASDEWTHHNLKTAQKQT